MLSCQIWPRSSCQDLDLGMVSSVRQQDNVQLSQNPAGAGQQTAVAGRCHSQVRKDVSSLSDSYLGTNLIRRVRVKCQRPTDASTAINLTTKLP